MGPAVPAETIEQREPVDGKIYEKSQQDGELYSKPTVGIIYPPPEVRSIFSNTLLLRKLINNIMPLKSMYGFLWKYGNFIT